MANQTDKETEDFARNLIDSYINGFSDATLLLQKTIAGLNKEEMLKNFMKKAKQQQENGQKK